MAIWSAEIKELEKLQGSFKGQLPDLEKELEQLIRTEDANVILLYSRRCLEVIITNLCECELKRPRQTEPLKGIIDKLHKERKVPPHIITSMHGLNDLSTYGTHPKDFDPEQIKPVLNNLDIIIKWYLKYKNIDVIGKIKGEEEKIVLRDEFLKEVKNEGRKEVQEKPDSLHNKKVLLNSIVIVVLLAIAVTFLYPKIFKRDTLRKLRSSGERIAIAVMPFQNMTNDTILNVWQIGIQDALINALSNSEELMLRQTESINNILQSKGLANYESITPTIASSISKKLDANVLIHGSIKQAGAALRLNAQLMDTKTDAIFKSFQVEGTVEKILPIIDSLSVKIKNYLIISILNKEVPLEVQPFVSTNSPEAYRYYIYGTEAFAKSDFLSAIKMDSLAVAIDSNFTLPAWELIFAYWHQGMIDQAKARCLKLYRRQEYMSIQFKVLTNYAYAIFFETPYETIKYLNQIL
jgi:TolB-like protein